jgi:hypothetical protein
LSYLVSNPGYGTWGGPYIHDDYYAADTSAASEYGYDSWGVAYTFSGGNSIISTGGGSTITRELAPSPDNLLRNRVRVVVTDLAHVPPGGAYNDSVNVLLTLPNGTGGWTTKSKHPRDDGFVQFDSIPIGNHQLRVVYLPTFDTLNRRVVIEPGFDKYLDVSFAEALW